MTEKEMIAAIADLYTATAAADWDKAASMLTDDFVAREADHLPMAGEYRGKNGLKELYTKVFAMAEVSGFNQIATTTGGEYVVTILQIEFTDASLAPAEVCERFRFRGDQICEIMPYYYNPDAIIAACDAKAKVS